MTLDRNLKEIVNEVNQIRVVHIVKAIIRYYGMTKNQIKVRYPKGAKIRNGKKMALYMLLKHTTLSAQEIANLFNTSRSSVYKAHDSLHGSKDPSIIQEAKDIEGMVNALIRAEYDAEIPF